MNREFVKATGGPQRIGAAVAWAVFLLRKKKLKNPSQLTRPFALDKVPLKECGGVRRTLAAICVGGLEAISRPNLRPARADLSKRAAERRDYYVSCSEAHLRATVKHNAATDSSPLRSSSEHQWFFGGARAARRQAAARHQR